MFCHVVQIVEAAGANSLVTPLQQTRHARKIYAGGLSNVTEEEIANYFNDLVCCSLELFAIPFFYLAFAEFVGIAFCTSPSSSGYIPSHFCLLQC